MSNTFDLSDALTKQTQFQAAKGGSGGLFDVLTAMYQGAFPRAPLANMLQGGRQAYNIGKYNQAVQAAQELAWKRQQKEDANNAGIYAQATGQQMDGPFNTTFATSMTPYVRKTMAVPSINRVLDGQKLELNPYGEYDPNMVQNYTERQGKVADAAAAQSGGLLDILNGGQKASSGFKMPTLKDVSPIQIAGGQGDTLTAGASQTNYANAPQLVDTTRSPYIQGADLPSNMTSLFGQGADDAQATRKQTEVERANKVGESQKDRELQMQKEGDYFKKYPPSPSGSQPSQTSALMGLAAQMGLSPQQTAQLFQDPKGFFGTGSTTKITPADLKAMSEYRAAYTKDSGGGFFKNPKAAQEAAANYNILAEQFGLPSIGAPFKNTAKSNLKQAGQNLGAKYGVTY